MEITVFRMFTLLRDKSADWDNIGLGFQISLNFRKGLRTDKELTNDARLEEVLNKWVETTDPSKVTWSAFISVLTDLKYIDIAQRTQTFLRRSRNN